MRLLAFETSKREWVPCTPGCSCRSLALQVEINMMQWESPIAKVCWCMPVVPAAILKPTLNVYITGHLPLLPHLPRNHRSSITQQQQSAFDTPLLSKTITQHLKPSNNQPLHQPPTTIMSGIINKVKDALHSDKAHEQPEGTHGHHSSKAANAADPRIDSDRDGRAK